MKEACGSAITPRIRDTGHGAVHHTVELWSVAKERYGYLVCNGKREAGTSKQAFLVTYVI
jgi:hypothetical protein